MKTGVEKTLVFWYNVSVKRIKGNYMNKKMKKRIINFIMFITGILIVTITFNAFCLPKNIVIGGVSGIAVILNYLLKIDISTTLIIGNSIIIIIGIIVLGFKDTLPSIIGSIAYTLGVYLTENLITINID